MSTEIEDHFEHIAETLAETFVSLHSMRESIAQLERENAELKEQLKHTVTTEYHDKIVQESVDQRVKETSELRQKLASVEQVSGELCEKCGWAMKFPAEPCRCELERENAELLRNALKHMSEILPQPKPTDKEALASLTLDALSDWDWTEKKDERPEPYTTIAKQHGFAPVPDGVRDATLRQLQHKR